MILLYLLSQTLVFLLPRFSFVFSFFHLGFIFYLINHHGLYEFSWLQLEDMNLTMIQIVDRLSLMTAFMTQSIGLCVQFFSLYYFEKPDSFLKKVHFFIVSMLALIFSGNFLQTFISWEIMGFCSYLLIGYYQERFEAGAASFKAFFLNKIGDVFFLLAIALILYYVKDLNFLSFHESQSFLQGKSLRWFSLSDFIGLCFLIAVFSKSAQLIFFIWLPDAMVGPSPASALIHAATMVAAGVYFLLRLESFFVPWQDLILGVALVTNLVASFLGIFQEKLKAILAYSTISQLAMMFLALGLGVYEIAFIHLITHAFFKAGLFLTAGAIIHEREEEDLNRLACLHKSHPFLFALFSFFSLALMGFPLFGAFYSKEMLLEILYPSWIFYIFLISLFLTNFYVFKVFFSFIQKDNIQPKKESFAFFKGFPLIFLAVFSLSFWMIKFFSIKHVSWFFFSVSFSLILLAIPGAYFLRELKEYTFIRRKFFLDTFYEKILETISWIGSVVQKKEEWVDAFFLLPERILFFVKHLFFFARGVNFHQPLGFIAFILILLYFFI